MANSEHVRVAQGGSSLLPDVADRLARDLPDAVYGEWPVLPTSYDAGYYAVTYRQLANAVNGLAWWLVDNLGYPTQQKGGNDMAVLAYMGPNDVRFTALVLAAIKTGYVLFFPSPRNSPAAHQALFDSLQCRILVTPNPVPAPAVPVLQAVKPRHLAVPAVNELLQKTYPAYEFNKVFEDVRWDPFLVVHTSGTTGLPKPLIWTHETTARQLNAIAAAPPDGLPSVERLFFGKRVLSTLPPFHAAGLAQYLLFALQFGSNISSPATATIATAHGVVEALKRAPADIAVLAPSIVAELANAHNAELLDYCGKHLELITYMGGDLPQTLGDAVAAAVPLRCQYGASEIGLPSQLLPPALSAASDWHYICFHPAGGFVFEEAADGLFECVVRPDKALADTQVAFTLHGIGQPKEHRTGDLFRPHPTVPNTWVWRARTDDIIVFLNGEKTNPVTMEQYLITHTPEVSIAMVLGAQRFQAALLVEPAGGAGRPVLTTAEQAAFIERIWPIVDEANRAAPAHAHIEKSMIIVAAPDRPLVRTPKGTIQRSATLARYAAEIDRLYANADFIPEDEDDATGSRLDPADAASIARFVRDSVIAVTGWDDIDMDSQADFFARGMDSLQALRLARAVRRGLYRPELGLPTIYRHPTVRELTAALVILPKNHHYSDQQAGEYASAPKEAKMVDTDREMMLPLLSTYRALIQQIPPRRTNSTAYYQLPEPVGIILTGSTGALGTLLLHALLSRPAAVGHVFCLNRRPDGGRAAQAARLAEAGLQPTDLLRDAEKEGRVSFLHADLAHPRLGLDEADYATLCAQAGLVLHAAWPVNFHLALPAFRPQLVGVVNLAALAAAAAGPRPMRLVFISSVGAVGGGGEVRAPAEVVYRDLDTPFPNGYGRSKFLAELLCDAAAAHLGLPVSVLRVGQVGGSAKGRLPWNRSEWLPRLVISSLRRLGCLPESLGRAGAGVDWMPADVLADAICDVALADSDPPNEKGVTAPGAEVFQLRNPRTTSWSALLPAIVAAAQDKLGRAPEIVPPSVWLARLEESLHEAGPAGGAADNPALMMLDFYRGGLKPAPTARTGPSLAVMSIDRALAASPTLGDMPAVSNEWMRKWVDEWLAEE